MDIYTKKIIKKTTPGQFRILVESIDEFPELATSSPIFGKSKVEIESKWDVVAQKINSVGPPMRSGSDWKRIWADMKCRTKAKITENIKQMKGTGGGPSYQNSLTDIERDIDRICQLSKAASPDGITFGTNRKEPLVLELTPPRPSTIVAVVTPTTSNQYSNTAQATSTPIKVMPKANLCKNQQKRKIAEKEQGAEIKLLKLQLEQNNALVEEMKVQTKTLNSLANSLQGIQHVLQEMLTFLKTE
ncbi:uncharacterized protein LOC131802344 [Musca domestica]|uniref:Regulatory protein zeste n=1 Tax=Musca domestica TaxID=7370 RepID=A0ABM3UY82_MUSDO|nr:uncharacterized protein LOC131802344 [Musca domestica]